MRGRALSALAAALGACGLAAAAAAAVPQSCRDWRDEHGAWKDSLLERAGLEQGPHAWFAGR